MFMIRIRCRLAALTALMLALLFAAPAFAKDCPVLDPVPLKYLLMPPPQADSEISTAELHELQDLQALRTRAQAEHAGDDHEQSVERFLGGMGVSVPDKPPAKPSVALEFFECIRTASKNAVEGAKTSFNRTRPYKYPNNRLQVLKEITGDDSSSYPAGHAAYGMVAGLILAEMLPEQKEAIMRRIEDYGMSRMVSGAHFRSDVYAGQIAGGAIVASYFKNKTFWDRFAEAKNDLRKALGYAVP
jgi:acid phosphatase (class A)